MLAARLKTPAAILLCGGAIMALSLGIRHGFGIFLRPMTLDLHWSRASFALAIALQNLVWGFAQPVVGLVADRYGAGRVLAAGGIAYALGLVLMAQSATPVGLALSAGLLIGLGLAGTYTIVIGVVGRAYPAERRSSALGVLSAMGSLGQFAMLPYGQALISSLGWWWALVLLAGHVALVLPLALPLSGRAAGPSAGTPQQGIRAALKEALGHRGFRLVTFGFFVCGFQVVFIATHLPAYLLDQGLGGDVGMAALALIGLANIAGSWGWGWLGTRCAKKYLLATIYAARAAVIAAFVAVPVAPWSVYLFAIALGLIWLGTVPLTSGLVAQVFGVQYLSMLFGLVYLGHQVGAFLGGWMGGVMYDLAGSYRPVWLVAMALSLAAALLNLLADDREIRRRPLVPGPQPVMAP